MTRKKALIIIKLTVVFAIVLLLTLFCVIIAQTVKINKLQNEIKQSNETYQTEVDIP